MKLWSEFASLFRRGKFDADMSEELRTHLELQIAQNLARGMPPDDARYAAQRTFGGVEQIKERARDQRGWLWVEHTRQDVRYAFRQLWKSPGFTMVVVLTLALGSGATTAIFSVVNTVILNPIAGPEAERLMQIGQRTFFRNQESFAGVAPPVFDALDAGREHFADFAWCDTFLLERKTDDFVVKESGARVPLNFFALLNARPVLGRAFAAGEAVPLDDGSLPTKDAAIVLSHAWWQSAFAGDPQVLGRGGIAVGLLAAFWLTRFLRNQLFNVSPTDPLVLATVVVVLASVALLACWLPALRAAQVDPLIALRAE